MGDNLSRDLNDEVKMDNLKLEIALEYHLQGNHFPPVSRVFVPICIEAINYCNDGDWEVEILLPNGKIKTSGDIVRELHLECFMQDIEE